MVDTQLTAPARPALVALPARIDTANADASGQRLAAAMIPGVNLVIADMTATTFCDSTGFDMLVLACQKAAANGTELRLVLPSPEVLRVMRILGVDAGLPLYQSLDEALPPADTQPQSRAVSLLLARLVRRVIPH
jgi:anti-sigma B factor antagonist